MPTRIAKSTVIEAASNKPKRIEEFVGRVNSKTAAVSIAVCLPAFSPDTVHRDA